MARLSKQDWLDEGFRLLTEFAQDKLRIAYLCDRLRVTRGSFYHHFESIDAYVSALLMEWEKGHTTELIRISSQVETGEERMQVLTELVFRSNQRVEAAIRSWSFYHEIVKQHLDKVDALRLSYLVALFKQMGLDEAEAQAYSKLEYATLIGLQHLLPDISQQELERLFQAHMRRMGAM